MFSSSLASLVQGNVNNLWAKHIKKWIFASWIFLTIGILLGSIWAYYELGWGGFWFWDPVENISLMPWLSLTALLHCILVLEKRSLLSSWTIILSISTFTLSVYGTFLVRSGILNSVHTFAERADALGYLGRDGYTLDGIFYHENISVTSNEENYNG